MTRPSGEVWLNFPDLRLGMIDQSEAAVDLLGVRNYAPSASYAVGDYAVYAGQLQRALVAITPQPYTATQWDPIVTKSYTDGSFTTRAQDDARYVQLAGSTMTGMLYLAGDPLAALQATTKQYVDNHDALKLNLSGGTMTGPLVLSGNPTAANQAANKGYVDTLVGNYLPLTGGTLSGTLRVNNGRIISQTPTASNPSLTVWDGSQNYAAGMYLAASKLLVFAATDGAGNPLTNFGWFDSSGNFGVNQNIGTRYISTNAGASIGGAGIVYAAYNSHANAFGWNGNVNCYVDNTYVGDIALTSWVNANFATYSWVNGNFKPVGAYTPNQNVDYNSNPSFWNTTFNGTITATSAGAQHQLSGINVQGDVLCLHVNTSGGGFIRFYDTGAQLHAVSNETTDYLIGMASSEHLKRDIRLSTLDCLDTVRNIPLHEFRYLDTEDTVPVGFVAQRVREVFPAGAWLTDMGAGIDTNAMLAVLVGAVQQLAKEMRYR